MTLYCCDLSDDEIEETVIFSLTNEIGLLFLIKQLCVYQITDSPFLFLYPEEY